MAATNFIVGRCTVARWEPPRSPDRALIEAPSSPCTIGDRLACRRWMPYNNTRRLLFPILAAAAIRRTGRAQKTICARPCWLLGLTALKAVAALKDCGAEPWEYTFKTLA